MTKTPDYSDEEELRFAYKTWINDPRNALREHDWVPLRHFIIAMIHTDDIK